MTLDKYTVILKLEKVFQMIQEEFEEEGKPFPKIAKYPSQMPVKVKEIEKVAKRLGFQKSRQKGSHVR